MKLCCEITIDCQIIYLTFYSYILKLAALSSYLNWPSMFSLIVTNIYMHNIDLVNKFKHAIVTIDSIIDLLW